MSCLTEGPARKMEESVCCTPVKTHGETSVAGEDTGT